MRKPVLISLIIIGILVLIGLFVFKTKTASKSIAPQPVETSETKVMPTLDPGIKVQLTTPDKRELTLRIDAIPSSVVSFDCEISYVNELDNQPTGALCADKKKLNGKTSYVSAETITLGTKSSGKARYHKVQDNKIKLTLRFNLSDETFSVFEKEYDLTNLSAKPE